MAEATRINDEVLSLQLIYPNQVKRSPIIVRESDAMRLVRFYNRLYIIEMLQHWLRQRTVALRIGKEFTRETACRNLLALIDGYDRRSLNRLCDLVLHHEKQIAYIAPGEKSKHYQIYVNNIRPIVEFCREMRGVEVA